MFVQTGTKEMAIGLQTALANYTIDLFQNAITVGPNTVAADLTPPTFAGYAQQTSATAPAPVVDPTNGGVSMFFPSHVFTSSGTPSPAVTMYGWMIREAGGILIAAGNFTTPIVIDGVGKSVPLQVTLNFP